ncbi:MAG: hypothetical protein ABEK50_12140 [bacterium]
MKEKLLMAIGLGSLLVRSDYVSESYRQELKRLGRRMLRDIKIP